MQTLLIVVHLLIVLALVGTVLIQRSEGGGLGIGGGGNAFAARGSGNALTRATGILAAAFFATSLALSLLARYGERPIDILDRLPTQQEGEAVPSGSGGVLDQLGGEGASAPSADDQGAVPAGDEPAEGVPSGTGEAPAEEPAAEAPEAAEPATDAPADATGAPAEEGTTTAPSGGVPTGQ